MNDWQVLDDGGLLERQAQIIRTLRLDYDTFTNSSFLLQGRADSFTVKTASERKQILADILGLSRYDLYEERAKAEAQTRKERAGLIEGEIKAIERDLARRADYEAQLSAARAAALAAVDALRLAEAEQAGCRSQVEGLRAQANQLADLRNRLGRAEQELSAGRQQLEAAKTRLAQIEAVLSQRDEIEAGWAALQRARADDSAWNARLLRHTQFQEQVNRAKLAVGQARLALEAEQKRLSDRHAELGRKVAAGQEQTINLAQARTALAHFNELEARRDGLAAELREVVERSAALKVESDRLKVEGQAVRDKMEMMAATEAAACPLCGQPLEPDHRDRMLTDLEAERTQLLDHYRVDRDTMTALAGRRAELEAEDADLARQLRTRDARQRQAAQAEAAVADAQAAAEEQVRVAEQMAQLAERLAAEDYAPAERADLARLQTESAQIGYDAAAHERVRKELERLAPFDARYQRQLLPALDGESEARNRVTDLAAQLARREADLSADRAEVARLSAAVADLPRLQAASTVRPRRWNRPRPPSAVRARMRARRCSNSARSMPWPSGAASSPPTWMVSTPRSASTPSSGKRSARRACRR